MDNAVRADDEPLADPELSTDLALDLNGVADLELAVDLGVVAHNCQKVRRFGSPRVGLWVDHVCLIGITLEHRSLRFGGGEALSNAFRPKPDCPSLRGQE